MYILYIRVSFILKQNMNDPLASVANKTADDVESCHVEVVDGHIYINNFMFYQFFYALTVLFRNFLQNQGLFFFIHLFVEFFLLSFL